MKEGFELRAESVEYEYPERASGELAEDYKEAIAEVEKIFAVITSLQEDRKNKDGEICEPITQRTISSLRECISEDSAETLAFLDLFEIPNSRHTSPAYSHNDRNQK